MCYQGGVYNGWLQLELKLLIKKNITIVIACEGCYCDYGYKVDVVVRPILWKKVADNDCYCEGSYNSLSVLSGVGV